MDVLVRTIAVIFEVALLAIISYAVLWGVALTAFDLGVGAKYKKAVRMALVAVGILMVVFYLSHLFTWYPAA